MDDTGICFTQSGNKKKYEPNKFSISPNKVKLVDFDNLSCEPFIRYTFTSSNKPPGVSLEDGTAMYSPGLRNLDPDIDLSTYLTYTPPDGYELVSEDHQYDTGVKKYHVSKYFYAEPFTVYYGTAGKTFNDFGLSANKYFYYKKKEIKDNKVNVKLDVDSDIIINGNTYHPQDSYKVISTIDLKSGNGNAMDILVSLDSNHYTGAFDINFEGCPISNVKIYLSVNRHLYQVNESTEGKRCYISRYKYSFHDDGYMFTTSGFDYTFYSTAWDSNGLFTQRNIRDDFGESIPSETKMKYVVKFTLDNGDYRQDCQLTVDVTTNK